MEKFFEALAKEIENRLGLCDRNLINDKELEMYCTWGKNQEFIDIQSIDDKHLKLSMWQTLEKQYKNHKKAEKVSENLETYYKDTECKTYYDDYGEFVNIKVDCPNSDPELALEGDLKFSDFGKESKADEFDEAIKEFVRKIESESYNISNDLDFEFD